MPKATKKTPPREPGEIQTSGNHLLDNVLERIRKKFTDLKIEKTSEEHQQDRGVDFQVELIAKPGDNTLEMFKLQVKATDDPIVPLKTTTNKGLISFQLSNRHIRYYQKEMQWALLFILCDNSNKKVYWYPIQLDDSLLERLAESEANNRDSIQIFIDPKNVLKPDTFLQFIRDAKESTTTQYFRANEENTSSLIEANDIKIDKNKSLLDQLFAVLDHLYDEVHYLPIHFLTQHQPFKGPQGQEPYYNQFKLYVHNEELFEMIGSFQVEPNGTIKFNDPKFIDGVKNYRKKARAVLTKLTQNHIYWLVSQKTRKEVSTRFFANDHCDCVTCSYNRLDIPAAIKKLQNPADKSSSDKMKTAYMHYEFGNYLNAAKEFQNIGKGAKKQNKKTLYLITQFNLVKLGKLIKNNYYDPETISFGSNLMDINLDLAVYSAPNRTYLRKLHNYIKEVRFYIDCSLEIQTGLNKLRSEYQSFTNGGSFSTHSYDQMLNGFAQLSSFIGLNRIIYDRFIEFVLQVDEFTEGIFIALALKDTNSFVISSFLDYHIHQLIFDGDHKVTWRFFNKYHLKSIPYKDEGKGHFFTMIRNLLSNHYLVKDSLKTYDTEEGAFWRNRYPQVFTNCLCMAAMLEMDDKRAEVIARQIMDCVAKADLPSPDAYSQVNSFFSSKRTQLSTPLILELIRFFLSYKDLYLQKRMGIFTAELKTRKQIVGLDKIQRNQLMDFVFEDKDELRHFDTLAYFHQAGDKILQKEIVKKISVQLSKKFDAHHYYHAVIMDVLPFQGSEFLEKFVAVSYPDQNKYSFQSAFYGPQDNNYPMYDEFFNLCFKFELKPSALTDRTLEGFGDYYDWLLDISGFDYSKFKIGWLGLYPTKYYLREFSKHPVLRQKTEAYLRKHRDYKIERLYFEIYNPENGETEPDFD